VLDLLYTFDKLDELPGYFPTRGERDISKQMGRFFSSFADGGDPNAKGAPPQWFRYFPAADNVLVVDEAPFFGMQLTRGEHLQGADCDFWDALAR
jgi:carboxylesterase type B